MKSVRKGEQLFGLLGKKKAGDVYGACLELVTARWGPVEGRETRSLSPVLRARYERLSREGKDAEQGREEYKALHALLQGEYANKCPLTNDVTPPRLAFRAKDLLSDKSQEKIEKGKWGMGERWSAWKMWLGVGEKASAESAAKK